MGFSVNTENAISLYKQKGGKISFENGLRDTLKYASKDNRITDIRELAYLLATAEVEGQYSLTRWESDYLCRDSNGKSMLGRSYIGVLKDDKPCQSAINYYCSDSGSKASYCYGEKAEKRIKIYDDKGLPYFGRGLIGITWADNYLSRGKNIGLGDRLLKDPDLIMKNPKISYDSAVDFLANVRKGTPKKSTFDLVKEGDLVGARRWVNGCSRTNCKKDAEQAYNRWMEVFQDPKAKLKYRKGTGVGNKKTTSIILGSTITLIGLSVIGFIIYKSRKSK